MDQIRFGILGAAAIAPNALIKPAHDRDSVTVTTVAARDEMRASTFAAKHRIDRVLHSYDDVIADSAIDAVYIPLPNGLHGEWTIRAIEAGKHVLCEKPFTANSDEARVVAAAAASSEVVVMEAFHWRYHRMASRLIEIVQGGEIGELEHIEAAICFPLPNRRDIRYNLGLAGGALMDAGCYAVNMVRALTGEEPEVVSARARMMSPDIDRAMTGLLRFPSGATGKVTASMLSRHVLSLRVRARGSGGEMRAFNPLMPKVMGSIHLRRHNQRRIEYPPRTDTYGHQLDAFVAAVRDSRTFPSTPEDAVRNMDVLDALYRASGLHPRQPTNGNAGTPPSADPHTGSRP